MSLYTRLLKYIIPYTSSMFLAFLCAVIIALCEMAYVNMFADTVDVLVDTAKVLKQTEKVAENPITVHYFRVKGYLKGLEYTIKNKSDALRLVFMVVAGIFILVFIKGGFFYGNTYLMSRVGYKLAIQFRKEMYNKIILAPMDWLNRQLTGDLMARVIDDVRTFQNCIGSTTNMLRDAIILVIFLIVMLVVSWKLTLLAIFVFPSLGYLINKFGGKIRQTSTEVQSKMATISSHLQEMIFGIQIIKSFTAEEKEMQQFADENQQQYRVIMKRVRLTGMLTPLIDLISTIGIVCVFGLSCWLVINGELTTGWFLGYIAMVGRIFKPIKTLGNFNSTLQQTLASVERIFYVLDFSQESAEFEGSIQLPEIKGEVEFRNVSFGYDVSTKQKESPPTLLWKRGDLDESELVLREINFTVRQGETVALVGHSGVGKTTLFKLLLRFYDVTEGEIFIDAYPLSKVTLGSLRSQIAIVPQDTILFNGTVVENILYGGPDATDKEVVEAAKKANAHDFIMQLPQGYETQIGERGVRLSGGQQQRIAIARAILKAPKILLLDEATSALDSESEVLIQASLHNLMKGRTTFVIAHRLSTVIHADQIFVLNKGRIVESGTHQQLLAQKGLYRKLCTAQLKMDVPVEI
ncbi:ABC transporter ATP-binding protein [Candidatus Poribacteria bacterium]|nr:ABC transporter ATP-binding protein [Candidatus Poribacteria bacterium]